MLEQNCQTQNCLDDYNGSWYLLDKSRKDIFLTNIRKNHAII